MQMKNSENTIAKILALIDEANKIVTIKAAEPRGVRDGSKKS